MERDIDRITADLKQLLRDVQANIIELKKSPDSPECHAALENYKHVLPDLVQSIRELIARLKENQDLPPTAP